jgi:hypothetical protein
LASGSFDAAKPHHPISKHVLSILLDTFQTKYEEKYVFACWDIVEALF